MKKILLSGLLLFAILKLSGQTQGLNYQAVIIDKTPKEIPGRDITGNIMPDHPLMIRFSILDAAGTIEYQEEHNTTTDMYGMINLVIGSGTPTGISPNEFAGIDWNGDQKSLKVDLSLSNTDIFYTDFSFEVLTSIPYAFHKNITATGSMIIDGITNLKSRVDVSEGSPTYLSGELRVTEETTLNNSLTVNATSNLKGQVTVNPDPGLTGDKSNYESYPLRIEGANQGIAVKINGTRSSNNYFVTFWDAENIQGRIEGQTTDDLLNDPEYIFNNILYANEVLRAGVDVGIAIAGIASASSSSTVCAGFGACVTAPIPSLIAGAIAQAALETANLALVTADQVLYNVFENDNIGVTYQSGAADYAEWLPKSDLTEKFLPGDIVGVRNGYISKNTEAADHYMVISHNPIVLGNMPGQGNEADYEKVAFMGQVLVKVFGRVRPGDFILPAGSNNGTGIAVSAEKILPEQYGKITGIAWSGSDSDQYGFVNVAVGLNSGYLAQLGARQEKKIKEQEAEITSLGDQIKKMDDALTKLVPGYSPITQKGGEKEKLTVTEPFNQNVPREDRIVVYQEITKDHVLEGLAMAKKLLTERGVDISKHPFFIKMEKEPGYKQCFIDELLSSVNKEIDKNYQEDVKSGAKVMKVK
jgi:hypothetical protein